MIDSTGGNGSLGPAAAAFNVHQQLSEANRLFQQNSYQAAAVAAGVVPPFSGHLSSAAHHNSAAAAALQQQQHHHHHHHHQQQRQAAAAAAAAVAAAPLPGQQHNAAAAAAAAAAVAAMGPPSHTSLSQLPHGLSNASQSIAAALFAGSPLISDDLKLAAAAAAAAAAAQSARGKKSHRAEPVPQSGFKGVSWNSRMKAWLAFYVTENGERKSKTFSTRKLGMEEARLQAITFCKQKQDQRRERKRTRELQNHQHCGSASATSSEVDKMNQEASMIDSPARQQAAAAAAAAAAMRCGYPTTPGLGMNGVNILGPLLNGTTGANVLPPTATNGGSEIAYVPIVPIAMNMIEKSGLLQPLELNELPPCQHCNKQPYPFLMIVSEGQEQTYSGSSIMSLATHTGQSSSAGNPAAAPAAGPNSTTSSNTPSGNLGGDNNVSSAVQHVGPSHTAVPGTTAPTVLTTAVEEEKRVSHMPLSNMSKLATSVL